MLDGGKDRLARFHNNFLIIPPGTIKRWPIGSRFSCFLMGLVFFWLLWSFSVRRGRWLLLIIPSIQPHHCHTVFNKVLFFPPIVSYVVCLAVKRIQTGADWMVAMRAGDVTGSWRPRGAIPPALGLSNLNEANRIDLRDSGTVERRGNRWNRSHRSVQFLQWSCFPTNAVLISPFCFTSTCWLKRSDDCNQWWWISSLCASFPDEICIRM